MMSAATCNSSKSSSPRLHLSFFPLVLSGLLLAASAPAQSQEAETVSKTPSRLVSPIDERALVTLKGNVREDLATAPDLGLVEDGKPLHLFLLLQRTTGQQADLDNLILRQQQATALEYHKWLTPEEFGARFGASPEDIAKIDTWLESHGFQVRNVLNNASMIDFAGTAGQVWDTFHTELHYFNIRGGKYLANVKDPQIPAALAPVVAGIKGLAKIPPHTDHTPFHRASYDARTHRWRTVDTGGRVGPRPAFDNPNGDLDVTPQDLYAIYNINPVFAGGNLAATATVAVVEQSDMAFGTVNTTTGKATGGDVVTFRSLFGVPGTLNMHVMHGAGSETCTAPGITANDEGEATLDAEWINATAPSANLVYMSCDSDPDEGIFTSLSALVDNNISEVMSMSYGDSELDSTAGDYSFQDTLYAQAATQGQSVFVSSADSGSDDEDQDTAGTATSGINVNALVSPLVTGAGGTDFSDTYDAGEGGAAQSTYWSATNSSHYGSAKGYVPETPWNDSCASSITAESFGFSGAEFCNSATALSDGYVDGAVVGGSGGISTHYAVPAWQTGISGYSNSKHSIPDIAGFAADGIWNHALISCDSNDAGDGCATDAEFEESGGTSFVAPYMAGVAGLLVTATGSRQGLLNPALYALGKAQYTAHPTECYSNGQTNNIGVTTGLPAASCIFNDVTTSNNDVVCKAGSTDCFVDAGATYGMLSLKGASSLSVAYPSKAGFDQTTGIGSVNVANLIGKWNTAFTSSTALSANPTSITTGLSTELKATVTGGTPTGYVDTPPALTGKATFKAGTTVVGSCTLSGGICSTSVARSSLAAGANSVTATFSGSGTYPSSVSSIVKVTVGPAAPAITLTPATLTFPNTVSGTVSDAQSVTVNNTGSGAATIDSISVAGADPTSYLELNDCGTTLAAGASCNVSVAFKPSSAALLKATLSVADNAAGTPQTVTLTGTGTAKPSVTLSKTSLTFASTAKGVTSEYQTVTLTNAGTSVLDISGIAITGTNAASFTELNTCGATLAPAANCVVYVAFKPTTTGTLTGSLTITDSGNASPQSVKLTGTGAA